MRVVVDRKSYRQFCGLARALDRVGDRWTLLVVRELLLGERTFRDLESALPGLSPSLLTRRLAELAADGLVERNDAPRRSKSVCFRLTVHGQGLEPAVLALIRWGSLWMPTGPGEDRVDPRWAPLALRALLAGPCELSGVVHLDVDGVEVTICSEEGAREVLSGHLGSAGAVVRSPLPALLALAADPSAGPAPVIAGDGILARALLAPSESDGQRA